LIDFCIVVHIQVEGLDGGSWKRREEIGLGTKGLVLAHFATKHSVMERAIPPILTPPTKLLHKRTTERGGQRILLIRRTSCFCRPKLLQEKNIRGICLRNPFSPPPPPHKVILLMLTNRKEIK
jgi:hypothetical protein